MTLAGQFMKLLPVLAICGACAWREEPNGARLIGAFWQGMQETGNSDLPEDAEDSVSNCVAIATIKAAFCRYGRGWSKRTRQEESSATSFELLDGSVVVVTDAEKECSDERAAFGSPKNPSLHEQQVRDEALWAYAVMGKRVTPDTEIQGFATCAGAATLRQGSILWNGPELLGIPSGVVDANPDSKISWPWRYFGAARAKLDDRPACAAASRAHVWFVTRRTADNYGTQTPAFAGYGWFRRTGGMRMSAAYCLRFEGKDPNDCVTF